MIISGLKIKEKVGQSLIFFFGKLAGYLFSYYIYILFNSFDILGDTNSICGIECGDGEAKRVFENRNSFFGFLCIYFVIFVMKWVNNKH